MKAKKPKPSEFRLLHREITIALGDDTKLNRLILLERKANQEHWGQYFRNLADKMINEYKEI